MVAVALLLLIAWQPSPGRTAAALDEQDDDPPARSLPPPPDEQDDDPPTRSMPPSSDEQEDNPPVQSMPPPPSDEQEDNPPVRSMPPPPSDEQDNPSWPGLPLLPPPPPPEESDAPGVPSLPGSMPLPPPPPAEPAAPPTRPRRARLPPRQDDPPEPEPPELPRHRRTPKDPTPPRTVVPPQEPGWAAVPLPMAPMPAPGRPINYSTTGWTTMLVFGDSTVDPGNNNRLQTMMRANFLPYGAGFLGGRPTGRFSNGRLITDILGTDALFFPCIYFAGKLCVHKVPLGFSSNQMVVELMCSYRIDVFGRKVSDAHCWSVWYLRCSFWDVQRKD